MAPATKHAWRTWCIRQLFFPTSRKKFSSCRERTCDIYRLGTYLGQQRNINGSSDDRLHRGEFDMLDVCYLWFAKICTCNDHAAAKSGRPAWGAHPQHHCDRISNAKCWIFSSVPVARIPLWPSCCFITNWKDLYESMHVNAMTLLLKKCILPRYA